MKVITESREFKNIQLPEAETGALHSTRCFAENEKRYLNLIKHFYSGVSHCFTLNPWYLVPETKSFPCIHNVIRIFCALCKVSPFTPHNCLLQTWTRYCPLSRESCATKLGNNIDGCVCIVLGWSIWTVLWPQDWWVNYFVEITGKRQCNGYSMSSPRWNRLSICGAVSTAPSKMSHSLSTTFKRQREVGLRKEETDAY